MRTLKDLFSRLYGSTKTNRQDALHYFVTQSKARDKKKVLSIIAKRVNEDQKDTIKKARELTLA